MIDERYTRILKVDDTLFLAVYTGPQTGSDKEQETYEKLLIQQADKIIELEKQIKDGHDRRWSYLEGK